MEYNDGPSGGVLAVVEGPGKTLEQQCGGYACLHKNVTGKWVKLAGEDIEDVLLSFFCGDKWNGWCDHGIDEETAVFIETTVPGNFVVDRARLAESCEAWVHGALNGSPAVLVWGNSD